MIFDLERRTFQSVPVSGVVSAFEFAEQADTRDLQDGDHRKLLSGCPGSEKFGWEYWTLFEPRL